MSVPRGIVVVVALGFAIATVGGSDMSGQLPATWQMVVMFALLGAAGLAVSGFGKKFLNAAASSLR